MNEESKGSQGPIRATKGGTILFVVQARRSMCVYVSLCVWFKVRVKKKTSWPWSIAFYSLAGYLARLPMVGLCWPSMG